MWSVAATMKTMRPTFDADHSVLADVARALAHPARLAILEILASRDSCLCGEIVEELPLAQATVSQHLKVLVEAGLITLTRKGISSCYCIDAAAVADARRRLDAFFGPVEDGARATTC
jgi:ArsR family transcriptional regulator, arsenate/arsenite/antimonite-responsive transcriptional repressor